MIKALVVRSYEEDILFSIELDQYFFYALKNAFETINELEKNLIDNCTVNISISNDIKICKIDPNYLNYEISKNGLEHLLLNESDLYQTNKAHWKIIEYPIEDYLIHPEYDKYYQFLSVFNSEYNKKIIFQYNVFHIEIFNNEETERYTSVAISYLDFKNTIINEIDTNYIPNREKKEEPLTKYYKKGV